jgi:hypothetical protein
MEADCLMNLDRLVVASALVGTPIFALAGCVHDASDVRSPDAEGATSTAAAGDRVPVPPPSADVRAELEAAQRKDAPPAALADPEVEVEAGAAAAAPVETSEVERRELEARSKERIAKLDARARELQQKRAKLRSTKKTTFETSLRRFTADRGYVAAKVDALARSGSGWKSARSSIERSLGDLEAALAKLDDQL